MRATVSPSALSSARDRIVIPIGGTLPQAVGRRITLSG
jgi:hypothetical protein